MALSLWLGCQEVFLDKGQEDDWFGSRFIRAMVVLAVSGFMVFVWRELKTEKPMVDLRLFRVRKFAVGTVLIFITSLLTYSVGLLTPQFLQLLMGYSSMAAGIATSPLGLGAVISMVLVACWWRRWTRAILVFGFLVFAFAAFCLSRITLAICPWTVFWPQILAGSAIGFLFVPSQHGRDRASATRSNWLCHRHVEPDAQCGRQRGHRSGEHASGAAQPGASDHAGAAPYPGDPVYMQHVHGLKGFLFLRRGSFGTGLSPALAALYRMLQQQAYLLAFTDVYEWPGLDLPGLDFARLPHAPGQVQEKEQGFRSMIPKAKGFRICRLVY